VIFTATAIPQAWLIDLERLADERGFFARTFCAREFAAHDLAVEVAQTSLAWNPQRGTLRGLHYQIAPHWEAKLVRCTRGAVHDVIVDLRPGSPAFKRHLAVELSAENRRQLYVPPGCAHGYLTLEDSTEVCYQMSAFHAPEAAGGVRYDDPAFAIRWPLEVAVVSERDRSYPDFDG
jgi:dTDP-4-dehydrorhamnose 3,5-epimerase